jgi:hypothetical protein
MAITYKEIKDRLTDLGFEEDDVAAEDYKRIYINSLNRAGEILYSTVMLQIEGYLLHQMVQTTGTPGELILPYNEPFNVIFVPATDSEQVYVDSSHITPITRITEDTSDDDEIQIQYVLIPLYTLLAAHYAWLDDDLTKATIYWNEFDDLKNQLIASINKPRNAVIIGGF